jgi:hypothetical protein
VTVVRELWFALVPVFVALRKSPSGPTRTPPRRPETGPLIGVLRSLAFRKGNVDAAGCRKATPSPLGRCSERSTRPLAPPAPPPPARGVPTGVAEAKPWRRRVAAAHSQEMP